MVEGQAGLTWERWSHILAMTERLGFRSLFRTDHFFVRSQLESLDAFLSFAVAAKETKRVRFGPLCTSFSLRPPAVRGRMAAQIDQLSGGRFTLGLGVSWYEPEFRAYGIPFPPATERYDRLEDGIELLRSLWSSGPSTYRGRFYSLEETDCLPKPAADRLPILIGGTGERRTLRAVAQYADEWNCDGYHSPEMYAHKLSVLERHCEAIGRDPATIRRSMLIHVLTGPDQTVIDRLRPHAMKLMGTPEWSSREMLQEVEAGGMLVGNAEQVVEKLGPLAELGVQEVELQHYDFGSDEVPEYIAAEVAPRAAAL